MESCAESIALGTRRELFLDDFLLDELDGATLTPALPQDAGIVHRYDRPWEGRYSGYGTILRVADGDYRFFYSGCPAYRSDSDLDRQACVLHSEDGIHWHRPRLGLFEVHGTPDNNVVLADPRFALNFAPFLDPRGAAGGEPFKAVAGTRFTGLVFFASPDGTRWRPMFDGRPVLHGDYLDSKNVVFWSEPEDCYVMYARVWRGGWEGHRWIGRSTSEDLEHWTDLRPVDILHQGRDVPPEHYYHNGTSPYFRAPHLYVALCSQFTEGPALSADRIAALDLEDPTRGAARGGGGLMTSRGGNTFQRTFMEEFIRPPIGDENWVARCNTPSVGVVQTGPAEMSLYVDTHSGQSSRAMRRYTLRLDGFASLRAPFAGGRAVTRPFTFEGDRLVINYATASRGSVRLQLETPGGVPLAGLGFEDCPALIGNEIARQVNFHGAVALGRHRGRAVRLRVTLQDADLYAIQFC